MQYLGNLRYSPHHNMRPLNFLCNIAVVYNNNNNLKGIADSNTQTEKKKKTDNNNTFVMQYLENLSYSRKSYHVNIKCYSAITVVY